MLQSTQRNRTALVLFTLSPIEEGRRKRMAGRRSVSLLTELIRNVQRQASQLEDTDFLISAPASHVCGMPVALQQQGGVFGEELRSAVAGAFGLGYQRVLVVGNDAPDLSPGYLRQAIRALELNPGTDRAVVGPANDGGFVLLGLTRNEDDLFRRIDWFTSRVAEQTEQALVATGFRLTKLAPLDDIDSRAMLRQWICGRRDQFAVTLRNLAFRIRVFVSREETPRPLVLQRVSTIDYRGPPFLASC